jgi:hypothetical protein
MAKHTEQFVIAVVKYAYYKRKCYKVSYLRTSWYCRMPVLVQTIRTTRDSPFAAMS